MRRRQCGADDAAPTMRRRINNCCLVASWFHGLVAFVAFVASWPCGLVASWLRGLVAARGRLTSAAGPRQHQATQGAEIMHHGFKDRPIDWEDDATSVGHRFSPLKIFWKGEPIQQSQIMDRFDRACPQANSIEAISLGSIPFDAPPRPWSNESALSSDVSN